MSYAGLTHFIMVRQGDPIVNHMSKGVISLIKIIKPGPFSNSSEMFGTR